MTDNGFFLDRIVMPIILLVFGNPMVLPFTMGFIKILMNNPKDNNDDKEWNGRLQHMDSRLGEVLTCSERTERRVGEQIAASETRMGERIAAVEVRVGDINAKLGRICAALNI